MSKELYDIVEELKDNMTTDAKFVLMNAYMSDAEKLEDVKQDMIMMKLADKLAYILDDMSDKIDYLYNKYGG